MKHLALALAAALVIAAPAHAQVTVSKAWIRATVPQQTSTGAFMQLQAKADTRLVAVKSPLAKAELHQMQMNGDRMSMREADSVALVAGQPLNLASGGYHIMLTGLKHPLKDGDSVPLSLVFEDGRKQRSTLNLAVPVKPLTYAPSASH
ncbi:MAG: copper chaperone PCu(A)C [Massilia sp.]